MYVHVWEEGAGLEIGEMHNFKQCHNWQGISLLDVVGNVFAQILQELEFDLTSDSTDVKNGL
jgi:hypothetical protein